jgi:hypothetical protein
MENKFTSFIKPYLQYIDAGHLYRKPFSWLYIIIAVLNLLAPIAILVAAINENIFKAPGNMIITFILVWIVIAIAGWISFQIWWDRKSKVLDSSVEGDDFTATPVFAHFIQTLGEWFGTWIGFVGFFFALFATLILGDDARHLTRMLDMGFMETGIIFIVLMPVYGFLIIVSARFLAEWFRALACIANNTRADAKAKVDANENDNLPDVGADNEL